MNKGSIVFFVLAFIVLWVMNARRSENANARNQRASQQAALRSAENEELQKRQALQESLGQMVKKTVEGRNAPSSDAQQPPAKSTPSYKPSLQADLAKTMGFCLGQRLGLQLVGEKFSSLSRKAALAGLGWDEVFKDAEANVEARLKSLYGKEWPETRAKAL